MKFMKLAFLTLSFSMAMPAFAYSTANMCTNLSQDGGFFCCSNGTNTYWVEGSNQLEQNAACSQYIAPLNTYSATNTCDYNTVDYNAQPDTLGTKTNYNATNNTGGCSNLNP